jgi:Na+/H+-dicarboxylate symporter
MSSMNIVRYVVGAIGFLLVWFVVALVIGLGMGMLFPPSTGRVMAGFGLDWRNLPGNVLGVLAGIRSFRASVRKTVKK